MSVSDLQLREHVQDELLWEPQIDASDIGVVVKDAVVTLSGSVESYAQKHAAGEAVMKIRGVRALANKIEVKLPSDDQRTDEEIARAIAMIFEWDTSVPKHKIHVEVSQGWVTLAGSVPWQFQKTTAEHAIHGLMGVKGITNIIEIEPRHSSQVPVPALQSAVKRHSDLANEIKILIDNDTILLSGSVETLAERALIERIAWRTPGIRYVRDDLEIAVL